MKRTNLKSIDFVSFVPILFCCCCCCSIYKIKIERERKKREREKERSCINILYYKKKSKINNI